MKRKISCSWNQQSSGDFVLFNFFVTSLFLFIGSIKFYAENSIRDPLLKNVKIAVAMGQSFCVLLLFMSQFVIVCEDVRGCTYTSTKLNNHHNFVLIKFTLLH